MMLLGFSLFFFVPESFIQLALWVLDMIEFPACRPGFWRWPSFEFELL